MEKITREELLKAKIPGEETKIQVKTGFCGFCGGDCLLDLKKKSSQKHLGNIYKFFEKGIVSQE